MVGFKTAIAVVCVDEATEPKSNRRWGGGGGGLKYFNFSPARWVRVEKPFSLNQVQVRD